MSENFDFRERIVIDSNIHFGKPCVEGTRIPVSDILELVEEGISFQEIRDDYYPDLADEDIKACIHYAREVIEAEEVHPRAS